jgi:hypothetical protein
MSMSANPLLGPVEKTAFLIALERVGNTSSKQELLHIRALLEAGMPLIQLFRSLPQGGGDAVEESEIEHVARDWFDPETGWWAESGPENVMRAGLIQSIDLSLEYGEPGENGKPFPVDYWWVKETGAFRFVSKISPQQQTVFLLTPTAPSPYEADGTRTRAKPKKAAKKSAEKAKKSVKKAAKKSAKKAPKKAKAPKKKKRR